MAFKAGDIVQLKSGGPSMTVDQTGRDGYDQERIWVTWFDENHRLRQGTFAPEALKPAEEQTESKTR